jgi:cytochrome c oxidase subunit 2
MSSQHKPSASCHEHGPRGRRAPKSEAAFGLRLFAFYVLVLGVIFAAVWLLRPPAATVSADQEVTVTMGGFEPGDIKVAANKASTIRLVNPDSNMHTDGGGVHQLAIPELGIDVKVQPESDLLVTIPAVAPGRYAFYCDVCCGGKENPMMQGALIVG